jgi:hypothetical protein
MFYRVTAQPTRLRQEGNLIGRSQLDKDIALLAEVRSTSTRTYKHSTPGCTHQPLRSWATHPVPPRVAKYSNPGR